MAKKKTLVRWQDGSYDTHLKKCIECPVDHYDAGEERYREIESRKTYAEWIGERTSMMTEENGESAPHEPIRANPDGLLETDAIWVGGEAYPDPRLLRLEDAVETLTDKQRAVWELVFVKGLTHEEAAHAISKETGEPLSRQAVTELAARALKIVQEHMGAK